MHGEIGASIAVVTAEIDDHGNRAVGYRRALVEVVVPGIDDHRGVGPVHVVPPRADRHHPDLGFEAHGLVGKLYAPLGRAQHADEARRRVQKQVGRAVERGLIGARRDAAQLRGRRKFFPIPWMIACASMRCPRSADRSTRCASASSRT